MQNLTFSDRLFRQGLSGSLATLKGGRIEIHDADGQLHLGDGQGPAITVRVARPRFYRHAVLGGSLSVAESYLRGDWICEDLTSLFRLILQNRSTSTLLERFARWFGWGRHVYHWWHANSRAGSRQNIAAHYDLGNDFFKLWLDETMAYSCAFFDSFDEPLEQASRRKFDKACTTLGLQPHHRVVEIGTGWGGFARHAATEFGCHVTSTTISQQQLNVARQVVEADELEEQVILLDQDYRDLSGQFDRLVSVEMIEAVGHQYFDTYFRKCSELLKPDGAMLLQAIVMADRYYPQYLRSIDYIQRYVFPGGCLPSVRAIVDSVARSTDMQIVRIQDFTPHYAETLRRWRDRFESQLDAVRQLGYSERFIRLWRYYLCYCEAAFEERTIGLVQMRLDKPGCPRTRELQSLTDRQEQAVTAELAVTGGRNL